MKRVLPLLILLAACGGNDEPKKRGDFINGDGFVSGGRVPVAGPGIQVQNNTISINSAYTQRRISQACTSGQSINAVAQDGTLTCVSSGTGTVSSVTSTASNGITVTNPSSTPNLDVDNTILQKRVTGTAAAGSAITSVNQNGTVGTGVFVNAVTGGSGITLTGSTLNSDTTVLQARLTGIPCAAGSYLTTVAVGGAATCTAAVNAVGGTGNLVLTGSSVDLATSVAITGAMSSQDSTASGSIFWTGSTTSTALAGGTTNNWDPKGTGNLNNVQYVTNTPSAASTVTGLVGGASGKVVTVANFSTTAANKITITNEDGGSTAANRFTLMNANSLVIPAGGSKTFRYDSGTSRWRSISSGITDIGNGLTVTGSTVAVNPGAGITADATSTRLNFPTTACTVGKMITAHAADGTPTCSDPIINTYASKHREWVDEWMQQSYGSGTGAGVGLFVDIRAGTGATASSTGTTTRPGILTQATGTTATGRDEMQSATDIIDFGSGNWGIEWTGGFPVLSTGTDEYAGVVGFLDSNTVNATDGCYFLYDRGNVASAPTTGAGNTSNLAKWACRCTQNGATHVTNYVMDGTVTSDASFTTVNAPVAALTLPSTNIQTLAITMIGATEADFYVNGVLSCKITTNIPTGSARETSAVFGILKSVGTTSTLMDTDRTRVYVDLTAAPSP